MSTLILYFCLFCLACAVCPGIGALAGTVGSSVSIANYVRGPSSGGNTRGTVIETCNNCCIGCSGNLETSSPRVGNCDNESCLCSELGPGVRPNVFDSTCSTFFNCPGPKQPCGPGTLFNPAFNGCDYPSNVKCAAIRVG
jgi:hypothetical protein